MLLSCLDFARLELATTLERVHSLENVLAEKDKSYTALKVETVKLKAEKEELSRMLENDKARTPEICIPLNDAANNGTALWDKKVNSNLNAINEVPCNNEQLEALHKEISAAKLTEESLRNYIILLEEDKELIDKELEDARKKLVGNESVINDLRAEIKEKMVSLDSLVNLLECQKRDHLNEIGSKNDQINVQKKELLQLQKKIQTETDRADDSKQEYDKSLDTISKLKGENLKLKMEATQTNALFIAMRVELQNALNDLAKYQHEQKM